MTEKNPVRSGTPAFSPMRSRMLQRKCSCGGSSSSGGECEACKKKTLQRWASGIGEPATVPPNVHEVLRSPGQPLDAATRNFMEPRFGHDFSKVRIHADARANESAQSVNALAYTVGSQIVFGSGLYQPRGSSGQKLLAHELTHVVQQSSDGIEPAAISSPSDPLEREAESASSLVERGAGVSATGHSNGAPRLFRAVSRVTCPANTFGAPADPRAALQQVDPIAINLATQAADGLAGDATATANGIPDHPSQTFQSYQAHFGLPIARGKGFLNRLTGEVRPTQAAAATEELTIMSRRFRLIAQFFSGGVSYICPGAGAVTLGACAAATCAVGDAFSCRADSRIALCQGFWGFADPSARAAILIHESAHVIWGPTGLSTQGEILDVGTAKTGPGGNFNVAGCYESIIDDLSGVNSGQQCPPVVAA